MWWERVTAALTVSGPADRDFFRRAPTDVARRLLGARLMAATPGGGSDGGASVTIRITEVEAYGGADDPGSHAFRGRTRRNAVMFGDGGFLYVYFTYGMHWCANVVCGSPGDASAVLIRAGEVVDGAELVRTRRPSVRRDADLARGPARLASALGLTGTADGCDLLDPRSSVRLEPRKRALSSALVSTGPRVGLRAAPERPWRFWITGDPTLSAYRPAAPRR